MKRLFLFVIIVLVLATLFCQSQSHTDELIKNRIELDNYSKFYTKYSIEKESFDMLVLPKDKDNNFAKLTDAKLNSEGKLILINQKIFTPDEAKYLAEHKCYISCTVASSGKIVYAAVIFSNSDPVIDKKKLMEFLKQIKENLMFELTFDREVNKIGYIEITQPAFPLLMTSKKSKK
jgi:hypothetical protein